MGGPMNPKHSVKKTRLRLLLKMQNTKAPRTRFQVITCLRRLLPTPDDSNIHSMGVMRWPIVELLTRHTHDFMAFHISQRYGCALKPLPLAAYRMRYLAHYLRQKVSRL